MGKRPTVLASASPTSGSVSNFALNSDPPMFWSLLRVLELGSDVSWDCLLQKHYARSCSGERTVNSARSDNKLGILGSVREPLFDNDFWLIGGDKRLLWLFLGDSYSWER